MYDLTASGSAAGYSFALRDAELALLAASVDFADASAQERKSRAVRLRRASVRYRDAIRRITGLVSSETV
jgi:hypothetical protein